MNNNDNGLIAVGCLLQLFGIILYFALWAGGIAFVVWVVVKVLQVMGIL